MNYLCAVKKILAIILFACMLVQCTAHLTIVGLFKLNQDYIAKNLCENRSKPQKKCCGKCYLRKQLNKVAEKENGTSKAPTIKVQKTELVCLLPKVFNLPFVHTLNVPSVYNPISKGFLMKPFPFSFFHPPSVSC